MILWVSENNIVIDAHPKGQTAKAHRSISGELVNLDNVKSEIKLSTSQGETTLKIKPETRSFVDLAKGTPVTIELNENGEVIDVHRDQR
jgi:tRNA threonylcarbamoyladenosine modification (KEOPS) complex  Pcc1 subunit